MGHRHSVPPGYELDPVFGCWLWTGRRDRDGYGRLPGGELAHRTLWESRYGVIPADKTVEHVCRRRACGRHLELLSKSEQELAKHWRRRMKRKTCVAGHELEGNRMITPEGGVVCRTCR